MFCGKSPGNEISSPPNSEWLCVIPLILNKHLHFCACDTKPFHPRFLCPRSDMLDPGPTQGLKSKFSPFDVAQVSFKVERVYNYDKIATTSPRVVATSIKILLLVSRNAWRALLWKVLPVPRAASKCSKASGLQWLERYWYLFIFALVLISFSIVTTSTTQEVIVKTRSLPQIQLKDLINRYLPQLFCADPQSLTC